MDEIGLNLRNGVVDDLALEGEGDVVVLGRAVDLLAVVEDAVLGEMNALLGEASVDLGEGVLEALLLIEREHLREVRQGDVHAGTLEVEGIDEGGGDVGEPARLGRHALGEVAHALREIGDLGGDNEDRGT